MTSALFAHCGNGNSHSLPFHSARKTNHNDTQKHRHIANSLMDQDLCSWVQCMVTVSILLHFAQLGDHLYPRHRHGLPLGPLAHGAGPKDVCVKVQLAVCGDTAAKIAVGPILTPVLDGLCAVKGSLSMKGAQPVNARTLCGSLSMLCKLMQWFQLLQKGTAAQHMDSKRTCTWQ